ncbi:MAG: hypothetical protein ACLP50_15580, partial [Solirubrobacteraceae bacterium]
MLTAAALAASAVLASGAAARPSGRFRVPADADQLVVVSSPTYEPAAPGYLAVLRTYERAGHSSPWRPVFPAWPAETGYGHLRDS